VDSAGVRWPKRANGSLKGPRKGSFRASPRLFGQFQGEVRRISLRQSSENASDKDSSPRARACKVCAHHGHEEGHGIRNLAHDAALREPPRARRRHNVDEAVGRGTVRTHRVDTGHLGDDVPGPGLRLPSRGRKRPTAKLRRRSAGCAAATSRRSSSVGLSSDYLLRIIPRAPQPRRVRLRGCADRRVANVPMGNEEPI
jgi:hypothetical protein